MQVSVDRKVSAAPAQAFRLFADAHAYAAAHSCRCRSFRYRPVSPTAGTVDAQWLYGGRCFRLQHRLEVMPPDEVVLDTIAGISRGARERVRLEPAAGGTLIHYEVHFSLSGALAALERSIAPRVRALIEELADEDVRALEGAAG